MDKRNLHLSFCKLCENKAFHAQKGVICNLTGEIADFNIECPDYEENNIEFQNQLLKLDKAIKEKYAIENKLTFSIFLAQKKFKFRKLSLDKYLENEHKGESNRIEFKRAKVTRLLMVILSIATSIHLFFNVERSETGSLYLSSTIILSCLILFMLYPIALLTFLDKVLLIIESDGILVESEKIYFSEIVFVGEASRSNGNPPAEYRFVLGTISKGIIEFNISKINISSQKLANIILPRIKERHIVN